MLKQFEFSFSQMDIYTYMKFEDPSFLSPDCCIVVDFS